MKTKKLLTVAITLFACQLSAQEVKVIEFGLDELEVRVGNEYQYLQSDQVGTPPILVLEEDSKGWIRLESSYASDLWVTKSSVKLNTDKPVVICKRSEIAQNPDKKQYGSRGAGESC